LINQDAKTNKSAVAVVDIFAPVDTPNPFEKEKRSKLEGTAVRCIPRQDESIKVGKCM